LLYSVLPWSWLVDWFANVGDILDNMSSNAVDNETLTNAYSMRTVEDLETVDIRVSWDDYDQPSSGFPELAVFIPGGSDTYSASFRKTNKLRYQASPFGFGLKFGDFTRRQLAILAALSTHHKGRRYYTIY